MPELPQTSENFDNYISELFAPDDDALTSALANMKQGNLPSINVSRSEGKLLQVLALAIGARRILEVGTLGGYSTTWLARALPADGKLITLELDAHHADVARQNLAHAGLADRTRVMVGPAAESLSLIALEGGPKFDLVFIDADKDGYAGYLEQVVPLTRIGGMILGDNTLTGILDPEANTGISRFNAALAARTDLQSVIVPTLRDQYDGLSISVRMR